MVTSVFTVWDDLRFPATAINPAGNVAPMLYDRVDALLDKKLGVDRPLKKESPRLIKKKVVTCKKL